MDRDHAVATFDGLARATVGLVVRNSGPVTRYTIALGVTGGSGAVLLGPGIASDLVAVSIAMVANYFLTWDLLRREDFASAPCSLSGFLATQGATLLVGLGFLAGVLFLLLPGLWLLSRWALVVPLVIGRGMPVFDAFETSWRETRPSQWAIFAITVAVFLANVIVTLAVQRSGNGVFIVFLRETLDAAGTAVILATGAAITLLLFDRKDESVLA
jgi:hypothetical protein